MGRMIGNIIEQYARDTFNLIPLTFNSYADAMLMNIPVEIKGILKHPADERNKNGRVWITNANHATLLKNRGVYLFVVYEYKEDVYKVLDYIDLDIRYVLFIAAYRIRVNDGRNTKISYKKLLEMI